MSLCRLIVVAALGVVCAACNSLSADKPGDAPRDVKDLARRSLSQIDGDLKVAGLRQPDRKSVV